MIEATKGANNVYDPDFLGSFSLEYVRTSLVPELTYDDLVIVDGAMVKVLEKLRELSVG